MAKEILMSVPSIPTLKRRAKDLLRSCREGHDVATGLATARHPELHVDQSALEGLQVRCHSDALHVLARSIGFASWSELLTETGPGVVRFAMDAKDADSFASEHCYNDERFHRWMVDEYYGRTPEAMIGETPEFWHAQWSDSWVVWRILGFHAQSVTAAVDEALRYCFSPFEAIWLGNRAIDVRSEYRGERLRFESNGNAHWTMGD